MSETQHTDSTGSNERETTVPRAVIHKQILSAAESRPDATIDAIAAAVSGATPTLVEQVLDEYGDPGDVEEDDTTAADDDQEDAKGDDTAAADDDPSGAAASTPDPDAGSETREPEESTAEAEATNDPDDGSPSEAAADSIAADPESADADESGAAPPVDPDDVTAKQLETLREIRRRPDATQAALAERLGVSAATINQRVNGIDGFDWSDRQAFVDRVFDRTDGPLEAATADASPSADDETETDELAADGAATDGSSADGTTSDGAATGDAGGATEPPAVETAGGATAVGDGGSRVGRTDEADRDADDRATRESGPVPTDDAPEEAAESGTPPGLADQVAALHARVETLERGAAPDRAVFSDPELAHKVVHACFASERISEAEELRILEALLGTTEGE